MIDASIEWDIHGFSVVSRVLDAAGCEELALAISDRDPSRGMRGLLAEPACQALAVRLRTLASLKLFLPVDSVVVQCTLFEKSPTKNWLVSPHQDLSIPVKERVDAPGLSGWAEKDGHLFVQPPASVLEALVAVRVHLDGGGPGAGSLRVVPGSHRFGRLDAAQATALRAQVGEIAPEVPRGGAFVMRPLLLHASSKSIAPVPRRVLHFVFGPPRLPVGLKWATSR